MKSILLGILGVIAFITGLTMLLTAVDAYVSTDYSGLGEYGLVLALAIGLALTVSGGATTVSVCRKRGIPSAQVLGVFLLAMALWAGVWACISLARGNISDLLIDLILSLTFLAFGLRVIRHGREKAVAFRAGTLAATAGARGPDLKASLPYYFLIMIALFMLGLAIGSEATPADQDSFARSWTLTNQATFQMLEGDLPFQVRLLGMFRLFLSNSLKVALYDLAGGFVWLGSIYSAYVNGFAAASITMHALAKFRGASIAMVILPHGIIEFPIMFLAGAYGLLLGTALYRRIRYKEAIGPWLQEAGRFFIRIAVPGLLLAAIIESFVSFPLAYWIAHLTK